VVVQRLPEREPVPAGRSRQPEVDVGFGEQGGTGLLVAGQKLGATDRRQPVHNAHERGLLDLHPRVLTSAKTPLSLAVKHPASQVADLQPLGSLSGGGEPRTRAAMPDKSRNVTWSR